MLRDIKTMQEFRREQLRRKLKRQLKKAFISALFLITAIILWSIARV